MKKISITTGILALTAVALIATSCKEAKKENSNGEEIHNNASPGPGSTMDHEDMEGAHGGIGMNDHAMMSSQIIGDYLELKNALVADDKEAAAKAGGTLVSSLNDFDPSSFPSGEQEELKDIIEDAKEHAEHIAKSPIDHQREHFDVLSKDVIDLIAITGTERTLYQDFCQMYNDNKGAQWLSGTKEIKNPYYGSKMMTCGSVQKQIN